MFSYSASQPVKYAVDKLYSQSDTKGMCSTASSAYQSAQYQLALHDHIVQRHLDCLLDGKDMFGPIHQSLVAVLQQYFHCSTLELEILQASALVSASAFTQAASMSASKFFHRYSGDEILHPKVQQTLVKAYCIGILLRRLDPTPDPTLSDEATTHQLCKLITAKLAQDTLSQHFHRIKAILCNSVLHKRSATPSLIGSSFSTPSSPSHPSILEVKCNISPSSSVSSVSTISHSSISSESSAECTNFRPPDIPAPPQYHMNVSNQYTDHTPVFPVSFNRFLGRCPQSPAPSIKETRRAVLPQRVKWGGSALDFEEFQHTLEGHFQQTGAGYLFNPAFQDLYKLKSIQSVLDFPEWMLSPHQCMLDTQSLYGAIRSACSSGVAKDILIEHQKTQDGLTLWMQLVDEYSADGDIYFRELKLEADVNKLYPNQWKKSLTEWVQSYVNAFAELVTLGPSVWEDDEAKKNRMLTNAIDVGIHHLVLTALCAKMSFKETCRFLKSHDLNTRYYSNKGSDTHTNGDGDISVTGSSLMSGERGDNDMASNCGTKVSNKPMIPSKIWRKLPRQAKLAIINSRKKQANRNNQSDPTTENANSGKHLNTACAGRVQASSTSLRGDLSSFNPAIPGGNELDKEVQN